MGNVAAPVKAPATQAAIFAGLGEDIPSTTINKVCASGMKSVMLAAADRAGMRDVVVVAAWSRCPTCRTTRI